MSTPSAAPPHGPLFRIGRIPQPWAWTDWEYAGDQRWDDAGSDFRTVYAAESAFACLVEVLAHFRPDPALVAELDVINVDAEDVDQFPTRPPGEVPVSWVDTRRLSTATVTGTYCDVTAAVTIAALRPISLPLTAALGLPDFDSETAPRNRDGPGPRPRPARPGRANKRARPGRDRGNPHPDGSARQPRHHRHDLQPPAG